MSTDPVLLPTCREWLIDSDSSFRGHDCGEPADFLMWGHLFTKDMKGPKCSKHLAARLDESNLPDYMVSQSAILDLRPIRADAADLRAMVEHLREEARECETCAPAREATWARLVESLNAEVADLRAAIRSGLEMAASIERIVASKSESLALISMTDVVDDLRAALATPDREEGGEA